MLDLTMIPFQLDHRYSIGNIKNDSILRTGDKATVRFRFVYQPEFVKSGSRILMTEGSVKVVGIIK